MTVKWSRHARDRLGAIHDHVAQDAPTRAGPFCDRLIYATEQLAAHPFSGPLAPEDGAYRQLVIDGYRLIYRVAEFHVYVMTIVAPGMLFEQAF